MRNKVRNLKCEKKCANRSGKLGTSLVSLTAMERALVSFKKSKVILMRQDLSQKFTSGFSKFPMAFFPTSNLSTNQKSIRPLNAA